MLAPDSDILALIGACGDSSQVASLGLNVACLALSGTKSDTVQYKFKQCIRFTKETQVELQKYYDCVCHDIERLQAHQRLHDVFTGHTLQLQNLLDESKAPKASTFLGRARNACSKAMPSLDKSYRRVSNLKKDIERHMDEVKVATASVLGENTGTKSRVAEKSLMDLNQELETKREVWVDLEGFARTNYVRALASKYLSNETLENWMAKWVDNESAFLRLPCNFANAYHPATTLPRTVNSSLRIEASRVENRNPFDSNAFENGRNREERVTLEMMP